jgi:hypothetical protein
LTYKYQTLSLGRRARPDGEGITIAHRMTRKSVSAASVEFARNLPSSLPVNLVIGWCLQFSQGMPCPGTTGYKVLLLVSMHRKTWVTEVKTQEWDPSFVKFLSHTLLPRCDIVPPDKGKIVKGTNCTFKEQEKFRGENKMAINQHPGQRKIICVTKFTGCNRENMMSW